MAGSLKGFGLLETPRDLLEKLRHDLGRMMVAPAGHYSAFDFFVTAEHMIDWVLPGQVNKQKRTALRASSPLLQVVSHIASGSKHFVAEARHHQHVRHVDAPVLDEGVPLPGTLFVTLDGEAAQALAAKLTVLELADRVLSYWEAYVDARWPEEEAGGRTRG